MFRQNSSVTRNGASRAVATAAAMLSFTGTVAKADVAETDVWYDEFFGIVANGEPLDTADRWLSLDGLWFEEEQMGHAAPVFYDWDRDGKRDLLVGGFSGRYRVYRNQGADDAPLFDGYEWIRAGGDVATVRNFCCVAAGIRMADIDGDGRDDLTAGSYAPGLIYWFRGESEGFASRRTLTDRDGIPLITRLGTVAEKLPDSFNAKPAWMDWDGDGDLDLIVGNLVGDLIVRRNGGPAHKTGTTADPRQPVFSRQSSSTVWRPNVFDFVDGGPGLLETEKYLTPATADWDQDGLVDIIIGVQSGAVYWLRNTGETAAPTFAAPEQLLPPVPGNGYPPGVLLEAGQSAGRGARASVDVADYNGDGKPDLIVGDWSRTHRPRAGLTAAERAEFAGLQQALIALDRRAGIDGPPFAFRDRTKSTDAYRQAGRDSELATERRKRERELLAYLEPVRPEHSEHLFGYTRFHGHVWVYLRK